MSDKDSDISNDAMPLPGMLPLQSHSEEDSCSNSTADVSTEPSISVENECLGEGTTPKTPCLGPGIIQPLGSGSSIHTELSPPHDQWAFNALLIKLAKQIDDNDLLQMKEMYNGNYYYFFRIVIVLSYFLLILITWCLYCRNFPS
jgi:hypothetical protein